MGSLDGHARGRTSKGRLAALDEYLCFAERALLEDGGPSWVIDLGFGVEPWTTLELQAALQSVNPSLRVLGVELEAERVEKACQAGGPVEFRQGGFELPLAQDESARLIRVMNVLRSYRPERAQEIHEKLSERLVDGGLLVEGTTDKAGEVLTAHLLRQSNGEPQREALLFHTSFAHGFAPMLFRDHLPVDLRRRVKAGEPIHSFLSEWTHAWQEVRGQGTTSAREAFIAAGQKLPTRVEGCSSDSWLLERGYLVWRPKDGVPA